MHLIWEGQNYFGQIIFDPPLQLYLGMAYNTRALQKCLGLMGKPGVQPPTSEAGRSQNWKKIFLC